jgi:hypothetical protein
MAKKSTVETAPVSPALAFLTQAWRSLPQKSWASLNSAMNDCLRVAVAGGMKFAPDDLGKVPRLGRWLSYGEGVYSLACGSRRGTENLSAAIAFETWWGREPWLWQWETSAAKRLHEGATLNWKGEDLKVTSLGKEQLVACAYEADRSAPVKVRRISRLDFDEERKRLAKLVRDTIKRFDEATDRAALEALAAEVKAMAWRPCDREKLKREYSRNVRGLAEAERKAADQARWKEEQAEKARLAATHDADLEAWLRGEDIRRPFDVVRLRLKEGDIEYIECTTGHKLTLKDGLFILNFARRHPGFCAASSGQDVKSPTDRMPITAVTAEGVRCGCTVIPLSEMERIEKEASNG